MEVHDQSEKEPETKPKPIEQTVTDNQPETITDEPKAKKAKLSDDNSDDEEAADNDDKNKSTAGVIYLSRIPTKMNVKIIREYFSNFGEVDRIYLEPKEQKRKNQPRSFEEGWVEFKKRRIAKKVAKMLNNMQVGGKRKNPWFSELWNLKYLKNFKWTHLNERLAYEQESRKQRLRQEVTLAKKEANFYIQNVEKNEKRKRFEKKQQNSENDQDTEKNSISKQNKNDQNDDDDETYKPKNKHPIFERKIKVAGNDTFLKQIFS
ncbi:unnamed protein product [Brachionus calyciflorus]|uniref:Activator of basal transcription 1 n=1 Tax=Brachionus calyciflorus TaxID=104777 RepID=A0A814CP28_9BILA|nr:unnamed protein product [Brachionus calyciflorus]